MARWVAVSLADRSRHGDVLAAGLAGAVFAGIPSTVWSLVRGDDVLDGARAAGAMVLPHERRTPVLLLAAAPVHLLLSVGWARVLAPALPPRAEPAWGTLAGLGIAVLDLAVIGRHIPAIRALPQGRQWADHLAYGATVGLVLHLRRRAAASGRGARPCAPHPRLPSDQADSSRRKNDR